MTTKEIINKSFEKVGRRYFIYRIFAASLEPVVSFVLMLLPGLIINELLDQKEIIKILILVILAGGVPLLSRIISKYLNLLISMEEKEVRIRLLSDFYAHTAEIEYSNFESPDFLDLRERVRNVYADKLIGIVNQVCSLLSALISLIAIISIISTLNPLMILVVLVTVVINSRLTKWLKEKQHEYEKDVTSMRRKMSSAAILEKPDSMLDVKLFGLKKHFLSLYDAAQTEVDERSGDFDRSRLKADMGYQASGLLQEGILYAYLIYRVLRMGLAVGSMTIYLSAIRRFSSALNSFVNTWLSISANKLWIEDLVRYQNMTEAKNDGELIPVFDSESVIEFKDVSFRYPGTERMVLDHLNLTIHGDEKLSIVGHNGSGKTTFIKLLIRLYEPTEGQILLNGIDIKKYEFNAYQKIFAPVFQDCALFYFSLSENIILNEQFDADKLKRVIEESDLASLVKKLSKGYDTQVYKNYDETGFNPSGGEEQKIAIARACYRGGNLFLLDEPTAALDPLSEYKIYTRFHEITEGKAAILITHRLSAVKLADRIAVFENGKVIENGSHGVLYARNGVYTEMYDKQSEFYRNNEVKA